MRRLKEALLVCALVAACGGDAGSGITATLAPTTTTTAAAVLPIVEQFEAAYESGDLDRVRALFTRDGMITTTEDAYAWHAGNTAGLGLGFVEGPEFERLATLHAGEDLAIIGTPIEVSGSTWAFGWEWSSGESGTALLHLRAGRKIVVAILDQSQTPIGSAPKTPVATTTSAPTITTAEPGSEAVPIAQEFQEAYASGDPDQVRALYAADGIVMTAGGIYGMHAGETRDVGTGFVGGSFYEYGVTVHAREQWWIIGTPIQVGADTVVFGWEWGSGVSGTALLHLRDGKIVVAILDVAQAPIWG